MNYKIEDLKEAVERLSVAVNAQDTEDVDMYVRLIKNIALQIKSDYWATYINEEDIVIQPLANDTSYKIINSLEFLYKPMHYINIYEGNEIEYFARERTEELNESNAIEAHNDFWKAHEIIFGTVYGSLPIELISSESTNKLLRNGWKRVIVDIIEFSKEVDESEIRSFANEKYRHYIIVREQESMGLLLLRYQY